MADKKFAANSIEVTIDGITAYTFVMPVKDILHLYYVAVRGVHDEDGAVQRPLSKRRIESIRDYILEGNTFFNSFILNWTEDPKKVETSKSGVAFPLISEAAQAIDGQHRLAGLEEAMEFDSDVGNRPVIVTLCVGLTTQQAAQIFLNINTEQRPVPKSLLFDLFGETASDPNHAINRARDIAQYLNEEEDSPLYRLIKFPGTPRGAGKIELSTFVSSLKSSLEKEGEFNKRRLKNLSHQQLVLRNFFQVLKDVYVEADLWTNASQNPFFKAAGFNGAIDFLVGKLIFKCAENGDFSSDAMKKIMSLEPSDALRWDDIKGLDGKTARKKVTEHLERGLLRDIRPSDGYKF